MSEANQIAAVAPGKERVLAPLLSVAIGPHIRTEETIAKIMWTVNFSLIPVAAWGIYVFGIRALLQMVVAIVACMLSEFLILKWRKKQNMWLDGSAVLTALLMVFSVPVSLPLWMTFLGAVFAIGVVKHCFGGIGMNIFNPAHAGRAFLVASFPVQMTAWTKIFDGTSTATPLGLAKEFGWDHMMTTLFNGSESEMYKALFFGYRAGSIGEVSTLFLLIGGAFLIYKRYIYWQTPFTYIATVALGSWALGVDPLFAIMSGGLMIGAFYMLTDMVTSPITIRGQVIFAFGAGVIVILIRKFGAYPEGVCYSILLMNCVTPLIDLWTSKKQKVKGN